MNTYYIKQVWFDILSNKVQSYSSQLWWQVLNKKQQNRVNRFTNTSYFRSRHYNPRDCMHTVTNRSRLSAASFIPISPTRLKKQVYLDPTLPGAIGINLSKYKKHVSRNISSLELLKRLANHNHSPDYFLGYDHESLDIELDLNSYNDYLQNLYLRSINPSAQQCETLHSALIRSGLGFNNRQQQQFSPSMLAQLERKDQSLFYTRKKIQAKSSPDLQKLLCQILQPINPSTPNISWNDIKDNYNSLDSSLQSLSLPVQQQQSTNNNVQDWFSDLLHEVALANINLNDENEFKDLDLDYISDSEHNVVPSSSSSPSTNRVNNFNDASDVHAENDPWHFRGTPIEYFKEDYEHDLTSILVQYKCPICGSTDEDASWTDCPFEPYPDYLKRINTRSSFTVPLHVKYLNSSNVLAERVSKNNPAKYNSFKEQLENGVPFDQLQ
ncbi:hypothetical protein C1645_838957 [Glomus cerebriforme]|uniref:Uncharacterized protein n=1 Tax=Glomus cerebriforme TaxID=658196 RepID=A0A397S1F7_9GLOM|nr:hypothetical protein C1645_838957 [Glomus cerebriforme]